MTRHTRRKMVASGLATLVMLVTRTDTFSIVDVGVARKRSFILRSANEETALTVFGGESRELLRVLRDADESRKVPWSSSRTEDGVVVYEPKDFRMPWAVVHFVGGAAFGTYPDVSYGTLLSQLCDRIGACCLATPYELTLDHTSAAEEVDRLFRKTLETVRAERAWPDDLKVLGLGHSLGAKLLLLLQADRDPRYDKLALMAANNFGLGESARLARTFLQDLNIPVKEGTTLTMVLDVALAAAAISGIDVVPSPDETLQLLQRAIALAPDPNTPFPATFLSFEGDDLDSSPGLINSLNLHELDVRCVLPGGHLSPVYINEFRVGSTEAIEMIVSSIATAFMKGLPSKTASRQANLRLLP